MILRLENENIRIRLSEREWGALNENGQLQRSMSLGLKKDLTVQLFLSDRNACCMEDFEVQIFLEKATLQKPLRKKDPYWTFLSTKGVQLSLDVDIIPEEKR